MKRARDTELELAVEKIVATANRKDEVTGDYVHPIMNETNPMILTFFQARDALLEVLKNRPVLFLNLLQTNKTLAMFWQEVAAKIWILLLDRLVEMETSQYVADIYPFFVIQNKRLYQELEKNYDDPTHKVNIKNAVFLRLSPSDNTAVAMNTLAIGFRKNVAEKFYIVYYAPVTQFFVTILRYAELRMRNARLNAWAALRHYLDIPSSTVHVICWADCFMVEESMIDANGHVPFSYDLYEMRKTLQELRAGDARYSKALLKLVTELEEYLDSEPEIEHPRPVLLDKSTAKPYRDLLFDEAQGLYNTPEEQKRLFLETLGEVSDNEEYVIARYGQPLQCSVCCTETNHVDPLLLKAFCSTVCHHQVL